MLLSPVLNPTLFSNESVEAYSPKGPEKVKITLYPCTGDFLGLPVKPHCSNFRMITAFYGCPYFSDFFSSIKVFFRYL